MRASEASRRLLEHFDIRRTQYAYFYGTRSIGLCVMMRFFELVALLPPLKGATSVSEVAGILEDVDHHRSSCGQLRNKVVDTTKNIKLNTGDFDSLILWR